MLYGNKKTIEGIWGAMGAPRHILLGPKNVGKFSVAMMLAKKYLCLEKNGSCSCRGCVLFDSGTHPDIKVIKPSGSSVKVADIQPILSFQHTRPVISPYKVVVIDDMDVATVESQNKLLISLEQSPEYMRYILVASEIKNGVTGVLDTIISRCQRHMFNILSDDEFDVYIKEEKPVCNIELIKLMAGNRPGLVQKLMEGNALKVMDAVVRCMNNGCVETYLEDLNLFKDKGSTLEGLSEDEMNAIIEAIMKLLTCALSVVQRGRSLYNYNGLNGNYDILAVYRVIRYVQEVVPGMEIKEALLVLGNKLSKLKVGGGRSVIQ